MTLRSSVASNRAATTVPRNRRKVNAIEPSYCSLFWSKRVMSLIGDDDDDDDDHDDADDGEGDDVYSDGDNA